MNYGRAAKKSGYWKFKSQERLLGFKKSAGNMMTNGRGEIGKRKKYKRGRERSIKEEEKEV